MLVKYLAVAPMSWKVFDTEEEQRFSSSCTDCIYDGFKNTFRAEALIDYCN